MKKKWIAWMLPGLAVLTLDRAVKMAAERGRLFSVLNRPILNSGMAFGWFEGNSTVILMISILLVTVCFILIRKMKPTGLAPIALSLIVGGAIGNMIDRVAYGYVIDMFPFFGWFVFNVADVGVVAGVILCGWSLLFRPQDWSMA